MNLNREIELLEDHFRTTQLVQANLLAGRERLLRLSDDARRETLLALQQQALGATTTALNVAENALIDLRRPQLAELRVG